MSLLEIPIWRNAPFIRLFPPLVIGVLLGYYTKVSLVATWIIFSSCALLLLLFILTSSIFKYRYYYLTGTIIHIWLMCTGCLLIYYQDITLNNDWFGQQLSKDRELRCYAAGTTH